ncbi:0b1f7687-29e2-4a4a-bbcc-3808dae77ca5 [Thermothielavioides terrestris]|uniref:0b1f7687-29e2-4a4a-bbcc-3808dae77ca5 n=1 Tax=Thermothielavioides terrestris TaxID=2587410 RepID=A0A3S4F0W2_9PEZI|nr:0b1f7687-29e2-4a4a-bbcc-3808dae77ca5 [Thermothielavioides terrestris]
MSSSLPTQQPPPAAASHLGHDHNDHTHAHPSSTTTTSTTTHPSPLLRTTALLSFAPALPLCVAHAALSADPVPAVGLVPLSFSAGLSAFLLLAVGRGAGEDGQRQQQQQQHEVVVKEEEEEEEGRLMGESSAAVGRGFQPGLGDVEEGEDAHGAARRRSPRLLTHRITVFVADVVLAAALMVVLVFTWIGTGHRRDKSPELAMLAAYGTVPLLVNFLIHLFLAIREFVAGLAIPDLVEYTAWRAVPPNCPHCGRRLRPDSLPPIPWYETVSRPNLSLPPIQVPSISRPSLPAFKMPSLPALKAPREWKVPKWMRGRSQEDASLFVDDGQIERDRYRDDPDEPPHGPSGTTRVVATGSAGQVPVVEEVVVSKKDRKGKNSSSALFGEDDASWP